jgi:murein endopeptidase
VAPKEPASTQAPVVAAVGVTEKNAETRERDVVPSPLAPRPAPVIELLDRPRWIKHRIVPRESLAQIASRYAVEEVWVRRWNDLPETGDIKLKKGKRLKVKTARIPPPREKVTHVVEEGETWWRIAVAHGVDSRDLRAYNWGVGRLAPGKELQVWVDPIVASAIARHEPASGSSLDVRPGGISVGSTNDGRLVNGVRLPESGLYTLRRPRSAYGTSHAVKQVIAAMEQFRAQVGYAHQVNIVAMSRPRGGPLGEHKSHRSGRDIDIRLPLRTTVPRSLYPKPWRVDWLATWELLRAFADTDEVSYVFLDYRLQRRAYKAAKAAGVSQEELNRVLQWPRGSRSSRGVVRHSPGHVAHFHVRFTCGPIEVECIE